MLDIIRDAPAGQFLRWLTSNRILLYPDEREGFVLPTLTSSAEPERVVPDVEQPDFPKSGQENASPDTTESEKDDAGETESEGRDTWKNDPEPREFGKTESSEGSSAAPVANREEGPRLSQAHSRQPSAPLTEERLQLNQQLELERTKDRSV